MPMLEQHIWSVTYRDGSRLNEYPSPDQHHSFTEVAIGDVVRLTLAPNHWLGCTGQEYVILCSPDAGIRPIMFRRVAVYAQTGESVRWNVCGTQQTVNGRNVKSLLYVPDHGGPIVVTDRDDLGVG